jgi:hypothetical protein
VDNGGGEGKRDATARVGGGGEAGAGGAGEFRGRRGFTGAGLRGKDDLLQEQGDGSYVRVG